MQKEISYDCGKLTIISSRMKEIVVIRISFSSYISGRISLLYLKICWDTIIVLVYIYIWKRNLCHDCWQLNWSLFESFTQISIHLSFCYLLPIFLYLKTNQISIYWQGSRITRLYFHGCTFQLIYKDSHLDNVPIIISTHF